MLRAAVRAKKKLYAQAAFFVAEARLSLSEFFAADPELLDAIADATEERLRREDRSTARIQWAANAGGTIRYGGRSPEIENFLDMAPPVKDAAQEAAEKKAAEERRKANERVAELEWLSGLKAWIAARKKLANKPHHG